MKLLKTTLGGFQIILFMSIISAISLCIGLWFKIEIPLIISAVLNPIIIALFVLFWIRHTIHTKNRLMLIVTVLGMVIVLVGLPTYLRESIWVFESSSVGEPMIFEEKIVIRLISSKVTQVSDFPFTVVTDTGEVLTPDFYNGKYRLEFTIVGVRGIYKHFDTKGLNCPSVKDPWHLFWFQKHTNRVVCKNVHP